MKTFPLNVKDKQLRGHCHFLPCLKNIYRKTLLLLKSHHCRQVNKTDFIWITDKCGLQMHVLSVAVDLLNN